MEVKGKWAGIAFSALPVLLQYQFLTKLDNFSLRLLWTFALVLYSLWYAYTVDTGEPQLDVTVSVVNVLFTFKTMEYLVTQYRSKSQMPLLEYLQWFTAVRRKDHHAKIGWKEFLHRLPTLAIKYFTMSAVFRTVEENPSLSRAIYAPLIGLVLYLLLDIYYSFVLGLITVITGGSYVELFDSPLLSSSLSDFWSRRWNRYLQTSLYNVGFRPAVEYLHSKTKYAKFVGISCTFLVSGLLHEWILHAARPNDALTYQNMTFFVIHRLLVLFENLIQLHTRIHPVLGWLWTMAVIFVTAPLFINPFIDLNILQPNLRTVSLKV